MDCCASTSKRQKTSSGNMNQLQVRNVNQLQVGNVNESDRFVKLPDDILMLILDKLPMEDAVATSFLSKRWKDLWKFKSKIDMGYSWVQRTEKWVLPSLFKILRAHHQEPKIKCLSVAVRNDQSVVFEVGLLMTYASLKNVEELHVDINDRNDTSKRWARKYPLIFLPDFDIAPCSSLRTMSLKFLQLETLPLGQFEALRELFLEHVILFYESVTEITAHCPSLELLSLYNCNPKRDLRVIVAESASLTHLIIKEDLKEVNSKTKLFIRAMKVKCLEFGLALPRKEYHVEVGSQCTESTIRLTKMQDSPQALKVSTSGFKGNFSNNFLGLLHNLKVVKKLTLSSWCIQVLSTEVANFNPPQQLEVTHLVLEIRTKTWEFPGIAYMLLACYKLENLVIVLDDHTKMNFEKMIVRRQHGAADVAYPKALQALTVVEFKNLGGDYQIWEDGSFDVDRFFAGFKYADLFLWNLRIYAKNLSKLVFVTRRMRYETDQVHRFGRLHYYKMLHPHFYRVPDMFVNNYDWGPEVFTRTA